MAKEKYILEITDFPAKGITSTFDVKDYGFIHEYQRQGSYESTWEKSFYEIEFNFGIVRAMDKYSARFYEMVKTKYSMMQSPADTFGEDELAKRNPLPEKFSQMTFSIIMPNSRTDYDFFEITVAGYGRYTRRSNPDTASEEIIFFFKKFKNFMMTVDKTTSP
jgi:hypothetical protein